MTRRALAAATGLILRLPAWVISAFQSAPAAPLAQVAASTGSAVRKASGLRRRTVSRRSSCRRPDYRRLKCLGSHVRKRVGQRCTASGCCKSAQRGLRRVRSHIRLGSRWVPPPSKSSGRCLRPREE
jgi:hypothetical protein